MKQQVYKYQDGREYTPTVTDTKEPRENRKSAPGENNQFSVRKPSRDSPLRSLSEIYEHSGWDTGFIKFPCSCEDWSNRGSNAVVVWRNMEHRIWCVCQVSAMSEQEMQEAAA